MMTNIQELCSKAKRASYELGSKSSQQKTEMLNCIGQEILLNAKTILSANKLDLDNAADLSIAMQDRLRLDEKRIEAIAEGVFQVAKLDDPIGEKTEEWTNEKGLRFSKIRVPLGVIGVIFEARPNVTADVASLCLMSG
ncbi:MAG: gamma-glutamyl-phosphate reductase, partial [Clostridia bacterium]